jgi:predicted nucleic acid-binding protein
MMNFGTSLETMEDKDLVDFLRQGEGKLVFDTNVLFSARRFTNLCDKVNKLNESNGYQLQIVVPALAHAEKIHDLRPNRGVEYVHKKVKGLLEEKKVEIMSFEQHHAEATAEFAEQFPDKTSWLAYKRERCCDCLSLTKEECDQKTVSNNKKCSATIDWLIAGYAQAEHSILVTDDKGIEFKDVVRKTNLDQLEDALQQLRNI